jgi:hypothetical protein
MPIGHRAGRKTSASWLAVVLCFCVTAALANEFWLQPSNFRVAVGALVPVRLLVGDGFRGETWPRPTRRTLRFVRLSPTPLDSTDLRPALQADSVAPAFSCATPGTHVVVLTSAPSFIELPPDKFTAYLRKQGLDAALLYRQQQGQTTTKIGREAYRRCAKVLVLATSGLHAQASPADTMYRRVVGLPLEFVPEQNPYFLRTGAALTVRVLRQGQPAAGVLVQVWDASPPAIRPATGQPIPAPVHFTTHANKSGRVLLRLPGAGPYLLATECIEPASPTLAQRADWLSTWATLTFEGPAAATTGRGSRFTK